MPYLKPNETDTLTLPSDPAYFVRIKRRATYGDQIAAQSSVMLKIDTANPGVISSMQWGAYIRELTASLIVEWNLTDENDQPLPVTAANIERLASEDGQFLAIEVGNRAKLRAVEQERPFVLQPSKP